MRKTNWRRVITGLVMIVLVCVFFVAMGSCAIC